MAYQIAELKTKDAQMSYFVIFEHGRVNQPILLLDEYQWAALVKEVERLKRDK